MHQRHSHPHLKLTWRGGDAPAPFTSASSAELRAAAHSRVSAPEEDALFAAAMTPEAAAAFIAAESCGGLG